MGLLGEHIPETAFSQPIDFSFPYRLNDNINCSQVLTLFLVIEAIGQHKYLAEVVAAFFTVLEATEGTI